MSNAMNQAMATSTPTEAVHDLLQQIANENNLDIKSQLDAMSTIPTGVPTTGRTPAQIETDEQSRRLAALRHAQ